MQATCRTALAIGVAAMCAVGVAAQSQETTTTKRTTVEIKDGKEMTVIGCLERRPNGDYILTQTPDPLRVDPTRLDPVRFALVTGDDLTKRIGERVEIKGKSVANGEG